MFLSMQSLNGDSYQGAQVGANVQSQVGPTIGGSSWLNQCRELSLSCLCTEPSTVQSEAQPKVEKKEKLLMRGQLKFRPHVTSDWLTVLTSSLWMEYFGSQNIIPPHCYHATKQFTAYNSKHFKILWMHLALTWTLGLVLVFWYCVFPFFSVFLYCCLILLLCVVDVFHLVLTQPHSSQNQCNAQKNKNKEKICLLMIS